MEEEQKSDLFTLGIFPKCPFYGKPLSVLIILVLIALGTWGIYYLNLWAAVGYLVFSLLFYFLVMPFTMCKHCYFKVIETSIDEGTGKTTRKLMDADVWGKTLLHMHAGQKHWTWLMTAVWFLPIILIIVSFFMNFSYVALIALISFVAVVGGNFIYVLRVKCPTCAIREYCHSAFGKQR
jgi:hypothetical protein